MKKVFIVVEPDAYYYGDRDIKEVFDTKSKAEIFISNKPDTERSKFEIDECDVK